MQTKQLLQKPETMQKSVVEMADAHCHLSILSDPQIIRDAVLYGVSTIITDGVDTPSNIKTLEVADNKNVFGAVGVDPEHALAIDESSFDREMEFNIGLARRNADRIVAIGEIGLDYSIGGGPRNIVRQKKVFGRFIDLAEELRLPVSVHARNAIGDVLDFLVEREAKRVHLHFFEGGVEEARVALKHGYLISVPPIESSKRKRVIAMMPIESLMAESDSPVVGQNPKSVEKPIRYIAGIKRMPFEQVAAALVANTKRFFDVNTKGSVKMMRY
ncbi:MAG: TatD family hydrolase [Candidatus Marsarchaeota archaeon]|jgi:TatD DNase family protein|nr:TatD family hydrolase [Candidatus Marsarchaeota archaeon]MCL5111574.1 TatD family hydrolase [Candidatus Marsarchaeota archaeon]